MLKLIRLDCIKHRVSRAFKRKFEANLLQLPGTYIQQAHRSKSVKGKSSSTSKKSTTYIDNNTASIQDNNTEQEVSATPLDTNWNKSYTPRPIYNDDWCKFNFTIICNRGDNTWYLRHSFCKNKCNPCHNGHHG